MYKTSSFRLSALMLTLCMVCISYGIDRPCKCNSWALSPSFSVERGLETSKNRETGSSAIKFVSSTYVHIIQFTYVDIITFLLLIYLCTLSPLVPLGFSNYFQYPQKYSKATQLRDSRTVTRVNLIHPAGHDSSSIDLRRIHPIHRDASFETQRNSSLEARISSAPR